MKYLLDTDICIYIINQKPAKVLDRFRQQKAGDIGVSSISVAELAFGVAKSGSSRNRAALDLFLPHMEIARFDEDAALIYGEVRTVLEKSGKPIGPLDMLIAAHALALNVTLVTNNQKEFSRAPLIKRGLKVENWA